MTKKEWKHCIPFFTAEECGEDMDMAFMIKVKALRIILDTPMIVICGYDERPGFHGLGRALDFWTKDSPRKTMRVIDRTAMFNGLGFYPWGAHLSFHIDDRPPERYQRWVSPERGEYVYLMRGT